MEELLLLCFLLLMLHVVQRNVLDHHVYLKVLLVAGTFLQRKNESCILVTCHIDYLKECMHIDTYKNVFWLFLSLYTVFCECVMCSFRLQYCYSTYSAVDDVQCVILRMSVELAIWSVVESRELLKV